ncbi:MAG TPA: SDR family NAD(P)-dependent oxidoreductase [Rhizomicrobium sp.]|jgi:3-oxoacyl-[acyl-carrier protein] reductase|nr:SDR family NAD(P)-dependent oxidoreductase [Rhizomicrobium sp.]
MRNVLVTGGSRGLGLAIAKKLVGDGFRVLALARKPTDELNALIAAAPAGALHFVLFDLAQLDRIADLVRDLKAAHGPLYGLVNNAGLGTEGVLSNMSDAKIESLIRLNVHSPLILTKAVMRSMMVTGEGRIVNMASIIGFTGYSGLSVYGATKAAMLGFTRSLAREAGRLGVTVNAVAPGFVDTEMTAGLTGEQRDRIASRSALKRLAEADDVASAVSYLMSEAAKNITGTTITVDAGNTA